MSVGRSSTDRDRSIQLQSMFVAAAVLTVLGVVFLRSSQIGGTIPGAFRGIGSQLGTTGPAAILTAVAMAVNVVAGATLMRIVRGKPFASMLDAALLGFAGAVFLNTLLMGVLGSVGLFSTPLLAVVFVLIGIACRRYWPLVESGPTPATPTFSPGFLILLLVVWGGPVLLQLASPVAPFRDVLHNHVAPAEYVRTYSSFPTLFTSPAPETGPARQILGYVGLLSTLTRFTGRPAALVAAALALPLTVLLAIATYRVAERILDPGTGMWALVSMPLTFTFLRLPDTRSTAVGIVLGLATLLPLPELTLERRVLVRSIGIAAMIYVHPLLGVFMLATHGLIALSLAALRRPEAQEFPIVAPLCAVGFAFPEFLLMAGRDAPSWIVGFAPLAGYALYRAAVRIRLPLAQLGASLAVAGTVGILIGATTLASPGWTVVRDEADMYPLLTVGFIAYLVTARARSLRPYLLVPVGVGVLAHIVATYFPHTTVFWNGARDEIVGKTAQYWMPTFLALGTAGALHWAWTHRSRLVAVAAVGAFLFAAALPVRRVTVGIEENREHRFSESLSISVRKAEIGGWANWPDGRRVVDGSGDELLAVIRREQAAGRLTRDTQVLHIAETRWTWSSTPIAAFTGAYDTNFSKDPDITGHTLGGRLYHFDDLPRFLNGARYRYVLLEPREVPGEIHGQIVGAGYRSIFRNKRGEIFRAV